MPRIKHIQSLTDIPDHLYDDYKYIGYEYERNILRHVLSPDMFANRLNDVPMRQIERLFEYLINSVRQIKLHFAFTFPKNSRLIN